MRFRQSHKTFRMPLGMGTALMLGFYTLAACRALVPGLCSTLSALETTAICITPAGCCAVSFQGNADARLSQQTDPVQPCAFCNLVETTSEPLSFAMHAVGDRVIEPLGLPYASVVRADTTIGPLTRRGPPSLSV